MKYLIGLLFIFSTANAALNEVDKAFVPFRNILINPEFETGKSPWTASGGTFALETSGSELLFGSISATWDSSSASQTLSPAAIAIPNGLKGKPSVAYCSIQVPSGVATHKFQVYDGTNVIAERDLVSNTSPVKQPLNFQMPSSGNITIRFLSVASNEPSITVDGCYLGEANNIGASATAVLAGESYFAGTTNCTGWSRTSTSLGAVSTDADCPGPTIVNQEIGSWQTTDADLPIQTINNLPPGRYKATFIMSQFTSGSIISVAAINDGSTTCEGQPGNNDSANAAAVYVSCWFNYTNVGNRSFQLYVASNTGSITIYNGNTTPRQSLKFILEKWPTSQEQNFTPDLLANSWSGYHDATCSWARTNTAYGDPTADASCALVERTNSNFGTVVTNDSAGSALPGIKFTPKRPGRYWVCAITHGEIANAAAFASTQLWDGTTIISESESRTNSTNGFPQLTTCGVYYAADTNQKTLTLRTKATSGQINLGTNASASSVEWTIFQIDQTVPMPFVTSGPSLEASASSALDFSVTGGGTTGRVDFDMTSLIPATDNTVFEVLVSTDGGATYKTGAADYGWASGGNDGATGTDTDVDQSDDSCALTGLVGVGNASGEMLSGRMSVYAPNSSSVNKYMHWDLTFKDASGNLRSWQGGCTYLANTAITHVRFKYATGNITSGKIISRIIPN